MPLSLGLRDEENERINSLLKKLIALVFVPDDWNETTLDEQLKGMQLSKEVLLSITPEELNDYLLRYNLDWTNMEQFADILARLSAKPGLEPLKEKAIALYNFIQQGSKMFSFEIAGKITALK
jgi:hypothetical protein